MMPFEMKINADAPRFCGVSREARTQPAVAEKAIKEGSAFTEKEALDRK